MIRNKLFIVNTSTHKKICISVFVLGKWFGISGEGEIEKFCNILDETGKKIGIDNYEICYENPFCHTPSDYKNKYIAKKFSRHQIGLNIKDNLNNIFNIREVYMNFPEAIKITKEGGSVKRKNWDLGMCMWWSGSYLLHTHPYFDFQGKSPSLSGYFYVCEQDDATAKDWTVVDS